jgi:anti-anti-sigma factor
MFPDAAGGFALSRRKNRRGAEVSQAPARTIRPARDSDWMQPEELHAAALAAAQGGADVVVDLEGLDYLDASSLQILLSLGCEQKRLVRTLRLTHASPALLRWFEYTGAVQEFSFV